MNYDAMSGVLVMALRCAISLKGVTQVAIAQRTPVKSADRALAIVEQ